MDFGAGVSVITVFQSVLVSQLTEASMGGVI